jgi:late competence protein required for DNA uptake (superfamily II DNA/RNA helicase)
MLVDPDECAVDEDIFEIKNRFDKKPVVTPGAAGVTNFTRQLRRNPLPLRIAQHQSNQG